jgi:hypothetical protein
MSISVSAKSDRYHHAHEAASAEVAAELLAKQSGFSSPTRIRASRCPGLSRGCRARNNDPEFGELTGLGIDLNRSSVLLDDNVVTQ